MNFFTDYPFPEPGKERFDTLMQHDGITVERIASNRLENGKWYDQETDEWVILVQGEAVLEFENGKQVTLVAGEHLFIEAHRRHRVVTTSGDALWLAVYLNS